MPLVKSKASDAECDVTSKDIFFGSLLVQPSWLEAFTTGLVFSKLSMKIGQKGQTEHVFCFSQNRLHFTRWKCAKADKVPRLSDHSCAFDICVSLEKFQNFKFSKKPDLTKNARVWSVMEKGGKIGSLHLTSRPPITFRPYVASGSIFSPSFSFRLACTFPPERPALINHRCHISARKNNRGYSGRLRLKRWKQDLGKDNAVWMWIF